jgi:Major Facilitator Superfamily
MNAIPVATTRRLLANRPLAAVVVANGVSSIGDWLYMTVLPLLVYRETGDAATVGLLGAARLLPWLLLSIPAGALVDRVPGPRLLIATDVSRTALMFLMAGLSLVHAAFPVVLGAALAAVVAGTVAMPAHGRLIPTLAGSGDDLAAANVVAATLDNLACVLGPSIAALLIVLGGIETSFVLNGMSFLLIVGVMVRIRPVVAAGTVEEAKVAGAAPAADDAVGILEIVQSSANRLLVDAAVSFAAGALWVLPVLAAAALALGDAAVGMFGVFGGVGGIVGALAAGYFTHGRQNRGMALGIAVVAIGIAAVPAGSSLLITIVGLTISIGAMVAVDTLNMTALQQTTPPHRLGRTLGVLHTTAAACAMAGSALPGVAFAAVGAGPACLLTAALVGICGLAALVGSRTGTAASRPSGLLPQFR